MSAPIHLLHFVEAGIASLANNKAAPPPGTIPSSIAALVACYASSTLSFFSFISVSV